MKRARSVSSTIVLAVMAAIIPLQSASAISEKDLHAIEYQSVFFDDSVTSCTGTDASGSSTPAGSSVQQIGQTMVVGFDAGTSKDVINDVVAKYHIGGIYLIGTSNAAAAGFDAKYYQALNAAAGTPLLVASDEEGVVSRYSYPAGSFPSAAKMATMSDAAVKAIGQKAGGIMASNGLTADLAPVLDLRDVGGSDLKGRSFSKNPATVADKAGAFADGLQDSKITPIFKHFPGFDSTTSGTTDDTKVVMKGSIDNTVKPYQTLLAKYPNAGVMLSNMYVNKLDSSTPSSMSAPTVKYLRNTLNFKGLITTDDLSVKSVTKASGSLANSVASSLAAGVTMPLFTLSSTASKADAEAQMDKIVAAVQSNANAMSNVGSGAATISAFKSANGNSSTVTAPTTCCNSDGVLLNGSDNLTKVYNFLIGKGLKSVQAIGIIGGLMGEAHLDPRLDQASQKDQDAPTGPGAGYGIAQWTTANRQANLANYAKQMNGPIDDLGIQLGFMWQELTTSYKNSVYNPLTKTSDLHEVVSIWVTSFESPKDIPGQIEVRYGLAQKAQKTLGSLAQDPSSGSTDTSTGSAGCGATGGTSSTLSNPAKGVFEYILHVPDKGVGHDVYYANQVTDVGRLYSAIDGESACGLTSLLMVEASLQGTPTPKLDANALYKGMSAAGAYSNADGIKSTAAYLSYIKSIGFKEKTILAERTGKTTDAIMNGVKQALGSGSIIIAHTSSKISISQGGSTSGHYLVLYAADDKGNFYVANPGNRADSPEKGYPVSQAKIESWLDGFYAVSN